MFYKLFTNMASALCVNFADAKSSIGDMMGGISQYFKCRSMCCTNINIYNPNSCCIQGEIFNKWVRATTPGVESPVKRNTEKFYTPENK